MLATIVCMVTAITLGVSMHLAPGLEFMMPIAKDYFEFLFKTCFFLSLLPWVCMLFLSQGAETMPITMSALRSNLGDRKMYIYSASIVLLSLIGMFTIFQLPESLNWSFLCSLLCAGLLLDLLRMTYFRLQYRRSPEGLADWFVEVMEQSVKKRDEKWHTISFEVPFSLMVVYMKCGAYGSLRLFCHKIVEMSSLWLGSIAQRMSFRLPGEFEESLLDRYSHAETMTAKRIAWLLQESCGMGSIVGVEETTRLAGRLFITFHCHHESLGFLLLQTLSQASQNASGKIRLKDLDMEVLYTYSEVIKSLIERCVDRHICDTTSILEVLSILENKGKEIFRREQTIDPSQLIRPLVEIGHMLGYDRYHSFPGREEILSSLRFTLAQFFSSEEESARLIEEKHRTDTKSSFNEGSPPIL